MHARAFTGFRASPVSPPSAKADPPGMTAGAFDKADVVASMFENVAKCMVDNAALLRQLYGRAESGALPGPSTAEGKASAKRKRAATKEEKVLRMLLNSWLDAWSVTHSTPHPSLCPGREAQALRAHPDLVPALHGGREGNQLFAETAPTEGNHDRGRQAVEVA